MAISVKSETFQETLSELRKYDTEEERRNVMEKAGYNPDEYIKTYYKDWKPIEKNIERKSLEEFGVSSLDDATSEQREIYQDRIDDELKGGSNVISRIAGRAIGDLATGVVEAVDMIADTTETGQKITDYIGKKADSFSDEYLSDGFKKGIKTLFDPYHSDTMGGETEKLTGQIAAVFIPATTLLKGTQLGLRATGALSPSSRAITSRLKRTATRSSLKTVGKKPTKGLGAVAKGTLTGAGYGAAYSIVDPLVGDIDTKLKDSGIDSSNMSREEKYKEYYKQVLPKNIAFDATLGAAVGGLAPVAKIGGKAAKDVIGEKTFKKITNVATNNKLSRFVRENLTSQRGVDDKVFAAGIKRNQASQRALLEAEGLTQDLKRAVKKDPTLKGKSKEQQQDIINEALTGSKSVVLSPEVTKIITSMRSNIDKASKNLKRNLVGHSKLQAVVDKNLGVYLNRSYDVFDDPVFRKTMIKRIKKFKPNDEVVQNAANFIKQRVGDNTSDQKVQDILLALIKATPEDDIARDLGVLSKAFTGAGKSAGALKRKKGIPPELKAFYGEIKDPSTQYGKTIEKLSRLNAEVDFVDEVKDYLLKKKLASATREQDFVQASAGLDSRMSRIFGRDKKASVRNSLDGLYVDPTYEKFIRQGLDDFMSTDNKFFQMFQKLKGASQSAKTVYNPATHVANTIGQAAILIANGILPMGKGAGKAVGTTLKNLAGKSNEELGKYQGKLTELGVVNSGVGLGMIRRNLQQAGKDPYTWMEQRGRNRVLKAGKTVAVDKPFQLYQAEDDVFKIMHFEKTREYLKKAYPKLSNSELDQQAAQRTRDLMPNYAQVSKAIQSLRVSPFGDFLSFPAEMIRISKNLGKYTLKDAASGNKTLQKEAAKKLAGLTTVGLIPSMAMEYSKEAHGITNDQVDAINTLAPHYEAFSNRIYLSGIDKKKNQKGFDYLRLGSLDPFDYLKSMSSATHQIINSVDDVDGELKITDRPEFNQAAIGLFENQMAPFVGTSMILDGVLKMTQGRKAGEAFVPSTDVVGTTLTDVGVPDLIANGLSIALDPFTPGFMNWAKKKSEYENSGVRSKGGAVINPEEVNIQGLLGLGKKRMDLSAGVNYHLRPFESILSKGVGNKVKNAISNPNASEDEIFEAYMSTQRDRFKAGQEIKHAMEAYRELGFNNRELVSAMSIGKDIAPQKQRLTNLIRTERNNLIPSMLSRADMMSARRTQAPNRDMNKVRERIRKKFIELNRMPLE